MIIEIYYEIFSDFLYIQVRPEQVIMAHSPLRMFSDLHNKNALVIGQSNSKTIATKLVNLHSNYFTFVLVLTFSLKFIYIYIYVFFRYPMKHQSLKRMILDVYFQLRLQEHYNDRESARNVPAFGLRRFFEEIKGSQGNGKIEEEFQTYWRWKFVSFKFSPKYFSFLPVSYFSAFILFNPEVL